MKTISKALQVCIIAVLPIFIILSAIRINLTPIFISIEYRLPGFPEDHYGFTTDERLRWAEYSIDYLIGRVSHDDLSNTRLPNGKPLFNQRELDHMLDVQVLTQQALKLWHLLILFLLVVLLIFYLTGLKREFLASLKSGAVATILIIIAIFIYVALNFNQLFTQFHQIFFEGDSWLFLFSDTLIRLFPLRFWRDLFIFIGILSLLFSLIIISISNGKKSAKQNNPKIVC